MAWQVLWAVLVIFPASADPSVLVRVGLLLGLFVALPIAMDRLHDWQRRQYAAAHRRWEDYLPRHAAPLRGTQRAGALVGAWIDPGWEP